MDIEKMIAVFPQYISEYLSVLFLILQKPTLRFLPGVIKPDGTSVYVIGESSNKANGATLNPKLISFTMFSIFIGALMQGITPNHPTMEDLPIKVVIVIALWLFISSTIFFFFRIFGGKGGFIETISISLQVIAAIYVVASFILLVTGVVFLFTETDFLDPFLVYLSTQALLLSIYLPFALKGIHFSSSKVNFKLVFAVTFSTVFFLFVGFIFYIGTGISLSAPPIYWLEPTIITSP